MSLAATTLAQAARDVLLTSNAIEKCCKSQAVGDAWHKKSMSQVGAAPAPDRPARPDAPALLAPQDVPRRRINRGIAGRIALLHALCHIELNAVDLAWDIIIRFTDQDLPTDFFDDWVKVATEEARHFMMLSDRLKQLDAAYGDLPAHDGLWDAALETRHDLAARLAIVPMVLEARGLDVTPAMIEKLRGVEDTASADILEVIYREEIGHVRIGKRWFTFVCARRNQEPGTFWRDLVAKHFRGDLKPPFNVPARDQAGLPEDWYTNVAVI